MVELKNVLERFNRKERNLLVRHILGHEADKPLPLSAGFRRELNEKLALDIPEDAWWATDYHISWLAGALAVLFDGLDKANEGYENPRVKPSSPGGAELDRVPVPVDERQLVEGNQEDVDLVIATGEYLILVEVKAHSSFGNAQLKSKLARLDLLYAFYRERAKLRPDLRIEFHYVLMSVQEPQKLTVVWPDWVCEGGKVPWIKLATGPNQSILAVTRCDEHGNSSAVGTRWRVKAYQ